ncbi:uncharacterized protein LOC130645976 [Hydractinia symbiolongicarpus]|uniref:uncharacterized protein LOC130645976 n=1 Tax=Hydractinia symbiolongicarpus TaxID=13093 RepID=UPI00254F9590|nr:uncharacterized protein LOC130645976 [Hydractinia symbiolongicarpus]
MNRYLISALSPNARSTYLSGIRSFQRFCNEISAPMFPLKELTLQLFVTFLAGRVKFSTIKVYLCGIQYQSNFCGYNEKLVSMHKLFYVLRGIRRCHPPVVSRRLPITPAHLHEMLTYIDHTQFSPHDKALWKCIILVAFFVFLRVSEYVCPSGTF